MTKKIKTGVSLSDYIKDIIDETVKSALYQRAVKEKALQRSLTEEDDDEQEKSDETPEEESPKKDEESSEEPKPSKVPAADDSEALSKGDVEADDIIEKLNAIRSGKSFRDDNIKKNMVDYVEGLDKAEKTALFAFLLAISQIVTAEIPATQVLDPSENPSDVKMKKGSGEKQTKHIKPNVIKANPPKKEKKPAGEDTSGPVPITPKK